LVLRLDKKGTFKFAALQSDLGQKALILCNRPNDLSSIVYIEEEIDFDCSRKNLQSCVNHHIKSEAVVKILKKLGVPIYLISGILPRVVKDGLYDIVAENRYSLMGKYDECKIYGPEYGERFLN